jgi:hypothetical protein
MAKWQNDEMLDAALNYIKNNAGTLTVCNAQPTTNDEAITTFKLADIPVDASDFTVGNGDTNGRKVAVAAQSGVTIDTSGTANHIALAGAGTLLYVTTCTPQVLTAGGTVDVPTFDIEIADAA